MQWPLASEEPLSDRVSAPPGGVDKSKRNITIPETSSGRFDRERLRCYRGVRRDVARKLSGDRLKFHLLQFEKVTYTIRKNL